jgi:ABC-type arginine transport system ATPase subunit
MGRVSSNLTKNFEFEFSSRNASTLKLLSASFAAYCNLARVEELVSTADHGGYSVCTKQLSYIMEMKHTTTTK